MVCPHCVYPAVAVMSIFFGAGAVANVKGALTVAAIGGGFYWYATPKALASAANVFNPIAATMTASNLLDNNYYGAATVCTISSVAYAIGEFPYVNFRLLAINTIGGGIQLYDWFFNSSSDHVHHHTVKALTMDFLPQQRPITISHPFTEGTSQNESFTVPDNEKSQIFGKGGLDSFILSPGVDQLYFSMCSTKIIDNTMTTIWNFNPIEDKIYLFCTLKDLDFDDIHFHKDHRMTQIIISGKFEETGIAVYMENDSDELTMENLVLNERFSDLTD